MTETQKGLSQFFSRLPIRHKLTLIIVGITFSTLVLSGVIATAGNYLVMRAEKKEQLGIMVDFTAKNVASALDFLDVQAAKENLNALAFDPSVLKACVYDSDRILFAEYIAKSYPNNTCDPLHTDQGQEAGDEHKHTLNALWTVFPIKSGKIKIGELELIYDLTEAHIKFFWIMVMNLMILLGALIMAYILANLFQRIISRPVTELAQAAHKFAGREDFSVRVEKTSDDELGNMVNAFNKMVEKMKQKNMQMQDYTDKLELAREEQMRANQTKSEFLANMSHELRTPLNSIIGMTRMITESETLDQDNREMAGTVLKSSTNLLDIVNDILDISKIEAGSIVLEKIGFDFKDTVASLAEAMAPLASAKGISLSYQFQNKDTPYIVGDPLRVSRILTNLVSNAIKYTDKGEVELTIDSRHVPSEAAVKVLKHDEGDVKVDIETTALSGGKVEIYCTVSDTGIGIPKDKLQAVFEKFSQADASTTRKYGGTGLGLAITKDLVELMGGEIGVESEVGKGSTFWFKIPFDVTDTLDTETQNRKRKRRERKDSDGVDTRIAADKARVLIAEDHILNQDFIKKLLPRMGIEHFEIEENGALAVKAYKEKQYDLILMDCHMPERNGYEATGDIRKYEKKTGKHIPIIAMTADAMKGTQEKCLKAGMSDYISKPVDSDELRDVLEQWIVFPEDEEDRIASQKEKDTPKPSLEKIPDPVDMSQLELYADTQEELVQFIEAFFEQSEKSLKILAENCSGGANKIWVEDAHKLKGGAGMIGAKNLYKYCEQAQMMAAATADERKAMLTKIGREYADVKTYLSKVIAAK